MSFGREGDLIPKCHVSDRGRLPRLGVTGLCLSEEEVVLPEARWYEKGQKARGAVAPVKGRGMMDLAPAELYTPRPLAVASVVIRARAALRDEPLAQLRIPRIHGHRCHLL